MSGTDPMKPVNPDVKPTPIRKHQAICANLLGMIWTDLREQSVRRRFRD